MLRRKPEMSMWRRSKQSASRARESRRRSVLALALVLQVLAATVFQIGHLRAGPLGDVVPCPMHAGMVMPAPGSHHPGQPSAPSNTCPCCGSYCACASIHVALPPDEADPLVHFAFLTPMVRVAVAVTISPGRHATGASARGPPSLTV